jgi:glutamate/tyrosine decarboxylase-like PLP-dependent enzyme
MHRDNARVLASAGNATTLQDPPAEIRDLATEAGISINGDAPWDIYRSVR